MIHIKYIDQNFAYEAHKLHKSCFLRYWSESEFIDLLNAPTNLAWAYYDNQFMVGLILISLVEDEGEILTLCTSPNYRKQGIAHRLLEHSIKYLYTKNILKLFLEVNVKNTNAIQLYEKLAFSRLAIRKNYYNTHEGLNDAVVMVFNFCYSV